MDQSTFVRDLLDQYEFRVAAYTSVVDPPEPSGAFKVYVKWLKTNGFEYLTYTAKTSNSPHEPYMRTEIYVRRKAKTAGSTPA